MFATTGVILAFAVSLILGGRDVLTVLLLACLCLFPASIAAYVIIFKVLPPKYVIDEKVVTLFRR